MDIKLTFCQWIKKLERKKNIEKSIKLFCEEFIKWRLKSRPTRK